MLVYRHRGAQEQTRTRIGLRSFSLLGRLAAIAVQCLKAADTRSKSKQQGLQMKAHMHLLLEILDKQMVTARLHLQDPMPIWAMRRSQKPWHPARLPVVHMTTRQGQMSSHKSARTGLKPLVCTIRCLQQTRQVTLKGMMRPDLQQQQHSLCPLQRPVLWTVLTRHVLPTTSSLELRH